MANRFRSFFESIVYAGMKPGGRPAEGESAGKPGLMDRFLSEGDQSDPLYLTNQTFGQKARRLLLTAIPVVLVIVVVMLGIHLYGPKADAVPKQLTAAEIAAKTTPAFNKVIKLDSNKDLLVEEVHFEHDGGDRIVGNLKNLSSHVIVEAVVVFDLADENHSQLGGVTVTLINMAAGTTRPFRLPIEQANAKYAVVREVRTQ